MDTIGAGPMKRAWLAAGYRYFKEGSLSAPVVFAPDDEVPVAALPDWPGPECEEVFFGFCLADLALQRLGRGELVERLAALDPRRAGAAPAVD